MIKHYSNVYFSITNQFLWCGCEKMVVFIDFFWFSPSSDLYSQTRWYRAPIEAFPPLPVERRCHINAYFKLSTASVVDQFSYGRYVLYEIGIITLGGCIRVLQDTACMDSMISFQNNEISVNFFYGNCYNKCNVKNLEMKDNLSLFCKKTQTIFRLLLRTFIKCVSEI